MKEDSLLKYSEKNLINYHFDLNPPVSPVEPPIFDSVTRRILTDLLQIPSLLLFTYLMNYLLGTNYWFLVEKPVGNNITTLMRPEPFHIIDLYIVALLVCYSMYLPFYLKDRKLS